MNAQILSQVSESFAKESLPKMHKELSGMSKQQAEIEFVREAQKLPDYGILFYGVSRVSYIMFTMLASMRKKLFSRMRKES